MKGLVVFTVALCLGLVDVRAGDPEVDMTTVKALK